MLGFAQTHQGFALDPPPFEKGGPKLYLFCMAGSLKILVEMPMPIAYNGEITKAKGDALWRKK